MKIKNKYLNLFLTMLKIGVTTFGGGYAMIAILQREFVEEKKWISQDEFIDLIGIAESTPGPIAINSATYIGYKVGKVWGSILATLGVVIPSFVIIFIISLFFEKFLEIKYVEYAFKGIQVCVTYLIINAGIKMFKGLKRSFINILILLLTIISLVLITLFSLKFSSIYLILISGFIGVVIYLFSLLRNKDSKSSLDKEGDK